jgi:prepilin-type N-terminal cleavage/methylation domain-containing protein
MRREKGFSLIELLIVIAIILVIAAIAIPNLLRSRMAANESSAAASIRTITAAEAAYYNTFPAIGYATQLPDLGTTPPCNVPVPAQACLIDNSIANAIPGSTGHSGYQFQATGISAGSGLNGAFVVGATPINANVTGTRDFCALTDAVLRSQPSTGGVPPVTLAGCLAYPITQ